MQKINKKYKQKAKQNNLTLMFRIINFHIHLLTYPYLVSIKFIAFSYFQLFISNYAQFFILRFVVKKTI